MMTLACDDEFLVKTPLNVPTKCRVRIFVREELEPVVVVTELIDNPGMSVTNAADYVWCQVIARFLPGWLDQAEYLLLVEHYPSDEGLGGRREHTYDIVLFSDYRPVIDRSVRGGVVRFRGAEWEPLGQELLDTLGAHGMCID